jgi:hypothetical protein
VVLNDKPVKISAPSAVPAVIREVIADQFHCFDCTVGVDSVAAFNDGGTGGGTGWANRIAVPANTTITGTHHHAPITDQPGHHDWPGDTTTNVTTANPANPAAAHRRTTCAGTKQLSHSIPELLQCAGKTEASAERSAPWPDARCAGDQAQLAAGVWVGLA